MSRKTVYSLRKEKRGAFMQHCLSKFSKKFFENPENDNARIENNTKRINPLKRSSSALTTKHLSPDARGLKRSASTFPLKDFSASAQYPMKKLFLDCTLTVTRAIVSIRKFKTKLQLSSSAPIVPPMTSLLDEILLKNDKILVFKSKQHESHVFVLISTYVDESQLESI